MSYTRHFDLADQYMDHIDTLIYSIHDPFIQSRYSGFLAVSAVTVYELAIKTIFLDFARKKHVVLGNFTEAVFSRLNGHINKEELLEKHVKKFGNKYRDKLIRNLKLKEEEFFQAKGVSIKACYSNIITWRNTFAHEGTFSYDVTYQDVKKSYGYGKIVIDCLAEAMKR